MKNAGLLSILIAVVLLALGVIAEAQQAKKVPRIGHLSATDSSRDSSRAEAFRQGLRELGTLRGKTLSLSGENRRSRTS